MIQYSFCPRLYYWFLSKYFWVQKLQVKNTFFNAAKVIQRSFLYYFRPVAALKNFNFFKVVKCIFVPENRFFRIQKIISNMIFSKIIFRKKAYCVHTVKFHLSRLCVFVGVLSKFCLAFFYIMHFLFY